MTVTAQPTYDTAGNVSTVADPLGRVTSYAYDALNRKMPEMDAVGTAVARTRETSDDAVGNGWTTPDSLSNVKASSRDALNRKDRDARPSGPPARKGAGATPRPLPRRRKPYPSYTRSLRMRSSLSRRGFFRNLMGGLLGMFGFARTGEAARKVVKAQPDALAAPRVVTTVYDAYGRITTMTYDVANADGAFLALGALVTTYTYDRGSGWSRG